MRDREARLDALREEAAHAGHVDGGGARIAGGPLPIASSGYHAQPVLKAPVWTWEVPLYFFVGGTAGAAAVIALAAGIAQDLALARDARWIAVAGALVSPALLVSDLGRPDRFLNMLRVAKWRSAMSVGAWTLVAFSIAAVLSLALDLLHLAGPVAGAVSRVMDLAAAVTGLVLATYTGVLLGVTAIPVWASHARLLPVHFSASSLGAAAGLLELCGHHSSTVNLIGLGAAGIVTATGVMSERSPDAASAPLRSGASGRLVRCGDVLAGAVPLVLRLAAGSSVTARAIAAVAAIVGSLCSRYGWVAAGRASAADPRVALDRKRG
jgi:formate-dependent nitrite reductase membrane component NrfD